MIERKPDEIVADKLQELICNYEENKQSVILEHLTALHKLRDERLYEELESVYDYHHISCDWRAFESKLADMQTFGETE